MDFTPMNLYKIPRIKRVTTPTFELATSVIFLSGIQHFAESPDGMAHVPPHVKTFLQGLPVRWDDVHFIDGYPGKYLIIGRRAGTKWYIAGINGESSEKTWEIDMSFLPKKKGELFMDDVADSMPAKRSVTIPGNKKLKLDVKPNGGFVMVIE
jgi:hypothetical protein